MKFDSLKFALAAGITWGFLVALSTLLAVVSGYGEFFLTVIQSIYPGFYITWTGVLVGLVYGFLDGFILGGIFALVYNWLAQE